MLKNVCCAICLSINKSTINIYNTDLLYVYETLANFKVADVECWMCYICHTRLQQCHQLQQLAVQTRGLIDDIFQNKIDIKFGAFGSLLELSTTDTMITDTTYYETPAPEVQIQFCDDRGANPDSNNVTVGSIPTISRDPLLDTVSDTSHDVQSTILLKVEIENNQNDDEYPLPTSSQFIGSQENTVSVETIQHMKREIVIKKLEAEFEGNEVEQKTNIKSEYAPTEKLEITFEEVTQSEIYEHDQYPTTSLEHAKIKQETAENIRDEGVDQIKQDTDKKQDACKAEAKKPHKCDVCSKRFPTKSQLATHSRTHIGEKQCGCDICYEKFLQKVYLKRHMLSHSEDTQYYCDICSKQYKRILDWQQHQLTHSDHKGFSCELCSKKFTKRRYLESHSFVHTGIRNYTCDVCSMKFSTKSGLNIHKHTHPGYKPHSCDLCSKSFLRKRHLRLHVQMHTGDKPYSCDICLKKFTRKGNLNVHRLTHTGDQRLL